MNFLLLMMAGSGERFGADIPKQFVKVGNKPIFAYILDEYNRLKEIDHIIVVTHKKWLDYVSDQVKIIGADKVRQVVFGGVTRSESVRNGLKPIADMAAGDDVILIHDATHPYVDRKGTKAIIEAVKDVGGATLAQRQWDTVYRMDAETHMLEKVEKREEIVSGASPEAFRFGDIYNIYMNSDDEELACMTSAGAIALHYNIPMKVVDADVINLKITYKKDMDTFEHLVDLFFPNHNGREDAG